jgi:Tol biopolymer transport system component
VTLVLGALLVAASLASSTAQAQVAPRTNVGIVWTDGDGVYEASLNGRSAHRITAFTGTLGAGADDFGRPAWSPDGLSLAYTAGASDSTFLNVVRPALGTRRGLSRDGAWGHGWSPDSSRLVVGRGWCGPSGCWSGSTIEVISPTGRRLGELTRRQRHRFDLDPSWSPDGKTVCFTRSTRDVDARTLLLVGLDGRGRRSLVTGAELGSCTWAPDSRRIAFAWKGAVWVIPAAGGVPARLGAGLDPHWSPDGRKILFLVRTHTGAEIWTMRTDGTDRTRVVRRSEISGIGWKGA